MNNSLRSLTDSRFAMWRAVIAMMHLDKVATPHEINYALECLKNIPLDERRRGILLEDMKYPACVEEVFEEITHPQDYADFFHFAKGVSWADGELNEAEERMIAILMKKAGTLAEDADNDNHHVLIADAVRTLKNKRAESGILFTGKSAYH